jgi:hypothetical protein
MNSKQINLSALSNKDYMKTREKTNFLLFNLLLSFFLTILITTPSIFFISDHIIGYPHDGFEYIYKFWWFKKAIFDLGISPTNTILLNYPVYDQNLTIISSPILPVISFTLSFLNSNLIVYNIMLFSSFIFSMGFMALICYEMCQNKLVATISGMIFSFNCNMVAHAIGGHLAQISIYLILIFVFIFLQFNKRRSFFIATLTGISGGICLLLDLKVAAYTFLPIYFFLLIFFLRKTEKKLIKKSLYQILIINLLIAMIVFPFFKPLLYSGLQGEIDYLYQPGAIKHSASLLSFIIPPPESFIIKAIPSLSNLSEIIALPGWHENVFFIGWITPLLAILGGIYFWKDKKSFSKEIILMTITMIFMVLGPYLKIIIDPLSININSKDFWISMPYFYLSKLPFFDLGRTPSRFMTLIWFGLSILSAYGIGKLIIQLPGIWVKRITIIITVVVILFEMNFTFPFPVSSMKVPDFYPGLTKDGNDFAILDLPLWDYRCSRQQMYFATIHQHPIVGGIITRRSEKAENSMKKIENYLYLSNSLTTKTELKSQNIKYVVFHKSCSIDPVSPNERNNLTLRLGQSVYSDELIDVFLVY